MKKYAKIISITLIILAIFISATNILGSVYATNAALQSLGNGDTNSQIGAIGSKIVPIVRTIGIIAAVVILMIVGIKYMMGSAEEKAEYKKTMPAYIIGAILVFGATMVIGWIIGLSGEISKGLTTTPAP